MTQTHSLRETYDTLNSLSQKIRHFEGPYKDFCENLGKAYAKRSNSLEHGLQKTFDDLVSAGSVKLPIFLDEFNPDAILAKLFNEEQYKISQLAAINQAGIIKSLEELLPEHERTSLLVQEERDLTFERAQHHPVSRLIDSSSRFSAAPTLVNTPESRAHYHRPTFFTGRFFATNRQKEVWKAMETMKENGLDFWKTVDRVHEIDSRLKTLSRSGHKLLELHDTKRRLEQELIKAKQVHESLRSKEEVLKQWSLNCARACARLDETDFNQVIQIIAPEKSSQWQKDYSLMDAQLRLMKNAMQGESVLGKMREKIESPLSKLSKGARKRPSKTISIDLPGIRKSVETTLEQLAQRMTGAQAVHSEMNKLDASELPEKDQLKIAQAFSLSKQEKSRRNNKAQLDAGEPALAGNSFIPSAGDMLLFTLLMSADEPLAQGIQAATGISIDKDGGDTPVIINVPGLDAAAGVEIHKAAGMDFSISDISIPSFDSGSSMSSCGGGGGSPCGGGGGCSSD